MEYNQEYFRRSAFGYVKVYNSLSPEDVEPGDVKRFQRKLQAMVCEMIANHVVCWQNALRITEDDD